MPPKVKITKEDVLHAAFKLTRADGFDVVNARSIAKELGCSTHPIFQNYENMAELKQNLIKYIEIYYNQYIESKIVGENPFLSIGLTYIEFAKEESNLFKMMFMSHNIEVADFIELIDNDENQSIIHAIIELAKVDEKKAKQIYINIWLYTHGIAAMTATNNLTLSSMQTKKLLQDAFRAFIK